MAETNGNEPHRNEPALLNIEDDMRQSYLDYAMSVNIGRALPQIRDGLKPVHRRILYAMFRDRACSRTAATPSAPASWAKCSHVTIRTATWRFTIRWCGWRSRSACATC